MPSPPSSSEVLVKGMRLWAPVKSRAPRGSSDSIWEVTPETVIRLLA